MRDGLVELVLLLAHMCRTWAKYAARATVQINLAATNGVITTTQRDTLLGWCNQLTTICAILKIVTGY